MATCHPGPQSEREALISGRCGVVSPIILSQARAQSREAQRAESSTPGKGYATNHSGSVETDLVKKQITLSSLAASPHPLPPLSPNFQPSPRIGSTGCPHPHPTPWLQTPSLPVLRPLQELTQLPSQKLRWKLSARLPLSGPPQKTQLPGSRAGGGRPQACRDHSGTCSEPLRSQTARVFPAAG